MTPSPLAGEASAAAGSGYNLEGATSASHSRSNMALAGSKKEGKIVISSHAPIEEFRRFRNAMKHPTSRLDLDLSITGGMDKAAENNQVVRLCREVLTRTADFQAAMEELVIWKNEFMKQNSPSAVKMMLMLLFSKLFRSNASLHEPLFELVRIAKVYSQTWEEKIEGLAALEEDHRKQKKALDVAIRKMEYMKTIGERTKREKSIRRWERIVNRALEEVVFPAEAKRRAEMEEFGALAVVTKHRGKPGAGNEGGADAKEEGAEVAVPTAEETSVTKKPTSAEAHAEMAQTAAAAPRSPSAGALKATFLQKLTKSLRFAFGRIVRHHHPTLVESVSESQTWNYPKVTYLSEVRERFVGEPKPSLARSFSVFDIQSQSRQRRVQRRHFRSNSFCLYEDQLKKAHATIRHQQTLFEPDIDTSQEWLHKLQAQAEQDEIVSPEDIFSDNAPVDGNEKYAFVSVDTIRTNAVQQFLADTTTNPERQVVKFDELWNSPEALLDKVDVDNTWFSLRDVMELILLHTQQMHALQNEYETQMREVGSIINQREAMETEMGCRLSGGTTYKDPYLTPLSVGFAEEAFAFNQKFKEEQAEARLQKVLAEERATAAKIKGEVDRRLEEELRRAEETHQRQMDELRQQLLHQSEEQRQQLLREMKEQQALQEQEIEALMMKQQQLEKLHSQRRGTVKSTDRSSTHSKPPTTSSRATFTPSSTLEKESVKLGTPSVFDQLPAPLNTEEEYHGSFRREAKPLEFNDKPKTFLDRLNNFVVKKVEHDRALKSRVRRKERVDTEQTLRAQNVYSRKGSQEPLSAKKIFPLEELDAVRQSRESKIPRVERGFVRPEPLGAHTSRTARIDEETEYEAPSLHTVNLFRDRKKNLQEMRRQ